MSSSSTDNAAEVMAVADMANTLHEEVEVHAYIDSMYTISGIARGEKRGRALVRSSCRAEWRRLFSILKGRKGTLSLEHVRSHARDESGELIEWNDMNKKQKMNHIADKLAGEGDSANYTHWKFPFGELNTRV